MAEQGDSLLSARESKQEPQPRRTSGGAFTYEPLKSPTNSIRLLVLEPGLYRPHEMGERFVQCRLEHKDFRQKPKYEALSYTWGTQRANKKTIFINGQRFAIGYNL